MLISLMGAGLAINRRFGPRDWASTWRLLGWTLPLTVVGVTGGRLRPAGMAPAAALLLGAVLAPTDPVLASDVQVGEPVDSEKADDEVRFTLTSEAGLNDGLAFPFGVRRDRDGAAGGAGCGWLREWVAGGPALQLRGGLRRAACWSASCWAGCSSAPRCPTCGWPSTGTASSRWRATFLAYGLTELVHGYGFIAVFVTACTIRAAERTHGYTGVLHGFIEQIERLFTAWLILLLGGFVAVGGLAAAHLARRGRRPAAAAGGPAADRLARAARRPGGARASAA